MTEIAAPTIGGAGMVAAVSDADYAFDFLRDPHAIRALTPEWEALCAQSEISVPLFSPTWLLPAGDVLSGTRILAARRGGKLVGVAPFRLRSALGFRMLNFLGKGVSPYAGFICGAGRREIESALLRELSRLSGEWDLLRFDQLAEPFTLLHEAICQSPLVAIAEPCPWAGSSYSACEGDWETLRQQLGWIKQGHRRVARMEREGGAFERHFGREAAELVPEILEVESRSWQGRYGQSSGAQERAALGKRLRETFEADHKLRQVELWLARIHGVAVAYEVNVLAPERIWLFRGGYDEAHARLSPGVVLDYLSVKEAWAEGRREFDYLSGGETYKSSRTDAIRPLMRITAAPRTLRGMAAFHTLYMPQRTLSRMRYVDAVLQFASRVKKSPRSLLHWSREARQRVHH
jgi:CelD/BcsL family acetyltransferase involved in cellulose biosynthesis